MAKDRSKEILKELKQLREELSARLDRIEERIGAAGGVTDTVDAETDAPASSGSTLSAREPGTDPHFSAPPEDPVQAAGGVGSAEPGPGSLQAPTGGDVQVVIRPLRDLGLARVVEDALAGTEGVESATLRELRGDSATIDTRIAEGVALISSLRRKLPVAFDVTESDGGSVTIALAQPVAVRDGSMVAVRTS